MKFTQRNRLTASLAAAVLAVSASAWAQPSTAPEQPQPSATRLNLSDAQKTKIQAIQKQYRENFAKEQADNHQRDEWLKLRKELLQAPKFDENKANQLIQLETQAHQKTMLNHLREDFEIFQVLTPQQREQRLKQFEQHHAKPVMGEHRHGKRPQHQHEEAK